MSFAAEENAAVPNAVKVTKTINLASYVKFSKFVSDQQVTWASSDENIATVTTDGTVTGVKAGEVTITATSKANKSKSASITITVSNIVEFVKDTPNAMVVSSSTKLNLTSYLKIADEYKDSSVTWSKDDSTSSTGTAIAIADGEDMSGIVKGDITAGNTAGTVTIKATVNTQTAELTLTIKAAETTIVPQANSEVVIPATLNNNATFDLSKLQVDVVVDNKIVTYTGNNIEWTIASGDAATIESGTTTLKADGSNTGSVTVQATAGGKTASFVVEIQAAE
jgi:hypothetical protein